MDYISQDGWVSSESTASGDEAPRINTWSEINLGEECRGRAEDLYPAGSFYATVNALSKSGAPVVSRALRDNDTVQIGHYGRMSVALAKSWSLIDHTGAALGGAAGKPGEGQPVPTSTAPGTAFSDAASTDAPNEAEGEPQAVPFVADADTESATAELLSMVPSDAALSALNSFLRDGEVSEKRIGEMASLAGVNPEEMAAKVQRLQDGHGRALMAKLGIHDEDAFGRFIQSSTANLHAAREGVRAVMMGGSLDQLQGLAGEFTENLDVFCPGDVMDALGDAGIPYERRKDGRLVVDLSKHIQGAGKVTWQAGVKMGLIPVQRA